MKSMETEQLTEQQLIDFARQHGCEGVNHWKLERWHKEDVIPRPMVEHLGYGQGTRSTYPDQAATQILAVCRLLKSTRNLNVVRFQLWQEGYPVPFSVLKQTIRHLVVPLKWEIPHQEEEKYDAVEQRLIGLPQKIRKAGNRFFRFLINRFGKKLEDLQSFIEIQFYWLYGIPVIFEPSHNEGEPSATDILTKGLGLQALNFLPKDLTADFQHFSDKGLLSISEMNLTLDKATEEDLRRASTRIELIALLFEVLELMGFLPKLLHSLGRDMSSSSFQALFLVFLLHLEKHGYADNIDGLLETCRVQVPRFRAFQALCIALQKELPEVARELDAPQKLWQKIKDLSGPERERYLARKNEHLRKTYLQHQAKIEAFWQRHLEIKDALEIESFLSS